MSASLDSTPSRALGAPLSWYAYAYRAWRFS
jgi:hypothetical protein